MEYTSTNRIANPRQPQVELRSSSKKGWIILFIILILAGGIGIYFYLQNASSSSIDLQNASSSSIVPALNKETYESRLSEFKQLNPGTLCTLDKFGFIFCNTNSPMKGSLEYIPQDNKPLTVEKAKDFLVKNAQFSGISNKEELNVTSYFFTNLAKYSNSQIIFQSQMIGDVPVENTEIEVYVDATGVYYVSHHWFLNKKITKPTFTEQQIKNKLAGEELTYDGFVGNEVHKITSEELSGKSSKVIIPIYSNDTLELRFAWKVPIGERGSSPLWEIYVDTVTGKIFKTNQLFNT